MVNQIAVLKNKVMNFYESIENSVNISNRQGMRFDTPVNFKRAMLARRHRWYTYKEGFSPEFVRDFIQKYSNTPDPVVFDPFGGIGTTVLESILLGVESYSNDINPMSNFIAQVKCEEFSENELLEIKYLTANFAAAKMSKKRRAPDNSTVLNYFNSEVLESILKVHFWIDSNIENKKISNVFLLALLSILEIISTHKKDGNGVKVKKNYKGDVDLESLKNMIILKLNEIIEDLDKSLPKAAFKICHQSSFEPYKIPRKADLVITSPPYANCFDYSKVYLVELWFGGFFKNKIDQKNFRNSSITSHVHYSWEKRHQNFSSEIVENEIFQILESKNLWNKNIPKMLIGYFSDIGKVLHELKANLNPGATLGFVVGSSVYGGLPIATDLILADQARKLGYEVLEIDVYRPLSPSSQQQKLIEPTSIKFLRESLVVLKWK